MPTLANIIKNIEPPIELTQEQYNALSEAQKNDGTVYFITDGLGPGITAGNISATDSGGDPSNVQAQLNKKIDKSKITTSTNVSTAGEYVADAQSIKSLNDALANIRSDFNITPAYTVNMAANYNTLVITGVSGMPVRGAVFVFGVGGHANENGTMAFMATWHSPNNETYVKVLSGNIDPTITLDAANYKVYIKTGATWCITAFTSVYSDVTLSRANT